MKPRPEIESAAQKFGEMFPDGYDTADLASFLAKLIAQERAKVWEDAVAWEGKCFRERRSAGFRIAGMEGRAAAERANLGAEEERWPSCHECGLKHDPSHHTRLRTEPKCGCPSDWPAVEHHLSCFKHKRTCACWCHDTSTGPCPACSGGNP